MSIERILVPTDFSAHSDEALRIGLALAGLQGATVNILHTDPLPTASAISVEPIYLPPALMDRFRASHDQVIGERLRALPGDEHEAPPGVQITRDLRHDNAVDGILSYAREIDANLIVMGSHGLTGAARVVLGSVAEKVSRHAPCPVLVVRDGDNGDRPTFPFTRALVGIDYSDHSTLAATLGAKLVWPDGAVELVHVWYSPIVSALNVSLGGREEGLADAIDNGRTDQARHLEEFISNIDLGGVQSSCYIGTGSAAHGLLERADEISADLIVVGAHARGRISEKVLGTVSDRVLRHAKCPVLLIPSDALPEEAE